MTAVQIFAFKSSSQHFYAIHFHQTNSLMAVRVNFRYNGSVGSCTTGSYDDHDDLVFAVEATVSGTTPPSTSPIKSPSMSPTVSPTKVSLVCHLS